MYPEEHPASEAVDGIYIPKLERSMAHSREELRPWWRVDLVDVYCVWAVNILNRANGVLNTLIRFEILTSKEAIYFLNVCRSTNNCQGHLKV